MVAPQADAADTEKATTMVGMASRQLTGGPARGTTADWAWLQESRRYKVGAGDTRAAQR